MKINKYIRKNKNKYEVYIDDEKYEIYDEVIIKNRLLIKKEVSNSELENLLKENELYELYIDCIKYIEKKMRSKKEIELFLIKKNVNKKLISKIISMLSEKKYLNEDIYLKAFINDKINLTNYGPLKIKRELINLGFDNNDIEEKLNDIDGNIWESKIKKYIDKKIKSNKSSLYMLKVKLKNDLIKLGYEEYFFEEFLSNIKFDEMDNYNKEYYKIKKSLEKKYSGNELEMKINYKLYMKGYRGKNEE